jgi:hypothetical protein
VERSRSEGYEVLGLMQALDFKVPFLSVPAAHRAGSSSSAKEGWKGAERQSEIIRIVLHSQGSDLEEA